MAQRYYHQPFSDFTAPNKGELPEAIILSNNTKSTTSKQLRILNINARSLKCKLLQLESFIVEKNLNVLCVTEHWMSKAEIGTFYIDGYKTLGFSSRKEYIGGGSAIFVCKGLKASIKHFRIDYNIEKCIEYSCVFINDLNVFVLATYRSPPGRFDTFLSKFYSLLNSFGINKRVIVAGNFNVHFGTNERTSLQLCDTGWIWHAASNKCWNQAECLLVFVGANMDVDQYVLEQKRNLS